MPKSIRYRTVPSVHRARGAGFSVERRLDEGPWTPLQWGRYIHHYGTLKEAAHAIKSAAQADLAACTRLGLKAQFEIPIPNETDPWATVNVL